MIDYCGMMKVSELAKFTDGQRKIYKDRVHDIINNYDVYLTSAVLLSKRADGSLHVIDGAHRLEASKHLGVEQIPVIVFTGLSEQEEAKYFILHEICRRRIAAQDKFAASIRAGEQIPIEIDRILQKNGYKVVEDSRRRSSYRTISAVRSLERIVKKYGFETLELTLSFIDSVWQKEPDSIHNLFLEGLAKFMHKAKQTYGFDRKYCIEKFKTIVPKIFMARSRGREGSSIENLSELFIEHYNSRLSTPKRIS